MNSTLIFAAVIGYIGFLFYVAHMAERKTPLAEKLARSPVVYALSLAVYCTSWTYYGSVGKAASSGLSFLAIYLGPTIMICLWWILLKRMVRIKNRYRVTSIADFISARYKKSRLLAGVVTVIALIGNMPYIALQLKAIKSTFTIITTSNGGTGSIITEHFGPFIVIVMTCFTILFGARKLDPTERHRGMITAIAVESVVKLFAFLACGIYVCYFLADGFSEIFSPEFINNPAAAAVLTFGQGADGYVSWSTLLLLSMSAIMFLPRQFHVAVVENSSPRNILTAMWLFPLYMVAINIFVVPIALYGINTGIPVADADTFVLDIPVNNGNLPMALLVFIGGFSAATGMIMISAMTMSTMTVNHLLLPLFDTIRLFSPMRRHLLRWHWIGIAAILSAGYWTESQIGDSYALVNMGLISFAAVLQFAPVGIGALFWIKGSRAGALAGLVAGFAVWFYTLMLPAFIKSGWLKTSLLEHGPWGIGILCPEHFFGLNTLPVLSHGVFWSLLCNIGLFVIVSLAVGQSEEERRIALDFHFSTTEATLPPGLRKVEEATIDRAQKMKAFLTVLNGYFSTPKCIAILHEEMIRLSLENKEKFTIIEFAELHRSIESTLAGSIGSAMAHRALSRNTVFSQEEKDRLSVAYADILSRLNVSPQELVEKVNFYMAREELLTSHSKELEKRILEKEYEIQARVRVEQALKQAEQQYRSIFENALEGIFQIAADGRLLTINPAMAAVLGYHSPAAAIRSAPDINTHLSVDPARRDMLFHRLSIGKPVKDFEIQVTHTSGGTLWLSLNARPILDAAGHLEKVEGIAEDITKRKEAEEKLARYHESLEETIRQRTAEVLEKQTFLEEVLEGIQAAVIVIHRDIQVVVDCNSIAVKLLGYDRKDMIGARNFIRIDSKLFGDLSEKSLNREFVTSRKDGTTLPVLRNVLPVVYKGLPTYAVILFDISERKALERQVSMAQKLQSIGQLAAGIAHEINTPIQYIGSNITFLAESFKQLLDLHRQYHDLLEKAQEDLDINDCLARATKIVEDLDLDFLIEEVPQAIQQSLNGVDQVASIVKAMKQFAHPEQDTLAVIDINSALEQTTIVARNEWKYVADLELDLDPEKPTIEGYPGPLNQVFLNIIVNATQAIAERVGNSGAKGKIAVRTATEKAAVLVEVSDTGNGIPADKINKVFDPFFTTKEVGKGTGQGLSIAYDIITNKHKGTIDVASTVGEGTTFTLRLPSCHG